MTTLRQTFTVALALSFALPACSDDAMNTKERTPSDGDLFLVATSFEAGDERETFFVTSPTFDETTTFDPTDGPKVLGGVVPVVHDGVLFVTDAGRPVIVRYDVGANDRLEKTAELSVMGAGVTEVFSWHTYVLSATKAYVFDQASSRVIVWNPQTMKLTGDIIDVSDADRDGWVSNLVFEQSGPIARGDELVIPLGWMDQDFNSRHASGALILDTKTDEVVAVLEDERCGESYAGVEGPGGDIYFFPPDWSALPHFVADIHQPTCVLRIAAGANEFDPNFTLDLSALGTGSAASGAVPDGETGFFFTALDEALWDDGAGADGEIWRFYHYDFETEESRAVESLKLWATNGYYVNVGGTRYLPREDTTDEGPRTTMYRIDGGSDPTEVFSFDASWYGAAKLK